MVDHKGVNEGDINMVKGNMVDLAFKEYEKIKIKDPEKARRLSTRGPSDIYGLHPNRDGSGYSAGKTIEGHFRNGRLEYVEE